MLEYKITSTHILLNTFTDPVLLAVNIILYMTLAFCFVRAKSKRSRMTILIFALILPLAYAIPTFLKTSIGWDWYGYELENSKLHIRAWPADEVIELINSTVFLASSDHWRPKVRTFGMSAGELSMGKYILNNGIKAVLFKHKDSERFVVINASGKYYVIIHPGVERLYEEILRVKGNGS